MPISHRLDELLEPKNPLDPEVVLLAIAELFISKAPTLQVYAEYCSNNQQAINLAAQTIKSNSDFAAFEKVLFTYLLLKLC